MELIALAVGVALFVLVGIPIALVVMYPVYLLGYSVGRAGQGIYKLTRRFK